MTLTLSQKRPKLLYFLCSLRPMQLIYQHFSLDMLSAPGNPPSSRRRLVSRSESGNMRSPALCGGIRPESSAGAPERSELSICLRVTVERRCCRALRETTGASLPFSLSLSLSLSRPPSLSFSLASPGQLCSQPFSVPHLPLPTSSLSSAPHPKCQKS